jgi:hypothetical protein
MAFREKVHPNLTNLAANPDGAMSAPMVEEDAERLEVMRLRRKAAQWRCATVHITDHVTARSLIILAANMDRKADDLEAGLAAR